MTIDRILCAEDGRGKLNFEAVTVTDVAIDVETRTITGLVLPYHVDGNTSGGKVSVDAGSIQLPSDLKRVKLLRDHNRADPVGYTAELSDDPDGLRIKFKVGNTEAGNLALTEAAEGIRDGLSVELSAVQKSPDGKRIVSAILDAVALVAVPAFSDARVSEVKAAQEQEKENNMDDLQAWLDAEAQFHAEQAALTASAHNPLVIPEGLTTVKKTNLTASQVFDALEKKAHGVTSAEITAALSDITRSANLAVSPVGFIEEVWDGVAYTRKIVPLFRQEALLTYKAVGWRWVVKPEVDTYAGDKTAIPSNQPSTESVTVEATRLAGGHDMDRKFVDFNETGYIASYFSAMAESYAKETDDAALAFLVSSALAGGAGEGLLKAIAIGANRVEKLTNAKATFALVNSIDMLSLLDVSSADVPAFLGLLGIDPASFTASPSVPQGQVIVGTKSAVTFYELAGSPIRVDAQHIANGGYDAALFGYHAQLLNKSGGVVKVAIQATGWTIDVTPATATIAVAGTTQLVVKDSRGNVIPNDDVIWTTSNAARATVSATGLVTGVATGSAATITASYLGKTDTAAITVS